MAVAPVSSVLAQEPEASAAAKEMVQRFETALNARDGKLLSSLFIFAPTTPCTDLDTLVFNEVSGTAATVEPLTLAQLARSEAVVTVPPAVSAVSLEAFSIAFGLTWTYSLPGEADERTLLLIVKWRVQKRGTAYGIVEQVTTAIGSGNNC